MPKEKGRDNKQKHAATLQRKPARREKKAIRKRVSADAFSRRAFLSLRIFLVPPVWKRRFEFIVCAVAFRSVFRRELVCGGA